MVNRKSVNYSFHQEKYVHVQVQGPEAQPFRRRRARTMERFLSDAEIQQRTQDLERRTKELARKLVAVINENPDRNCEQLAELASCSITDLAVAITRHVVIDGKTARYVEIKAKKEA
jgi:hypothetical protein